MKQKTSKIRCERCGEILNPKTAVWLELSETDGKYYQSLPRGHKSQGGFSFGSACANKVKNPSQSAITKCRKVLGGSEAERELPTISRHWEMENPMKRAKDLSVNDQLIDSDGIVFDVINVKEIGNKIKVTFKNDFLFSNREPRSKTFTKMTALRVLHNPKTKTTTKNPLHGKTKHYHLVNEKLKIFKSSNDYDKLQEKADDLNEKSTYSGNRYYVISDLDYRIAMAQKGNPKPATQSKGKSVNPAHKYRVLWKTKNSKFHSKPNVATYKYKEDAVSFYESLHANFNTSKATLSDNGKIVLSFSRNPKAINSSKVTGAGNPKDWEKQGYEDIKRELKKGILSDPVGRNSQAIRTLSTKNYTNWVKGYFKAIKEKEAKKKPNFTNADFKKFQTQAVKDNSEMFQGFVSGERVKVMTANGTPKTLSRLGDLKQMIVKLPNGTKTAIKFDGDAFLAMDTRKNLHCVGKDSRLTNVRVNGTGLADVGDLIQIDYQTAKAHIGNGKETYYYHKLGEVTGEKPRLMIDKDKFLHIVNGNYDVWSDGIVN